MAEKRWVVFDAEADSLEPDIFWCLHYHDYKDVQNTLTDYEDMRNFFKEYDSYIGHNIRRWDLPQLTRVVNIPDPKEVIDTMGISWYLEPKRRKNGLEAYGEEQGIPKVKINDWKNLSLDEYIARCKRDVEINLRLWKDQLKHLMEIYGSSKEVNRFLKYLDAKMYQASLAEKSKWKLDVERCKANLEILEEERKEKYDALVRAMPKVPIKRVYERPKRYRNSDGQLSALGQRWEDRLRQANLPPGHEGSVEEIVDFSPPNPGSSEQVKDWLFSLGWKPAIFKDTVRADGTSKKVPQVNKDKQSGGGVCESVLALINKEPAIEHLDGLGIILHRRSILNGFLRDADENGYLTARVQGFTNTLRFKHTELVNMPKPDARYGELIRSCLIAPEGDELCGADMSGLEDRLKQHFLFKHDPEYVKSLMDPTYDPHLDLAFLAEALSEKQVQEYKDKIRPENVTTIRSIYKNGNYA